MPESEPKILGKYQLLGLLATGGMAEIFLARQTGIGGFKKLVVVKKILPHLGREKDFVEMFVDEAVIAAQLNHPNVVQINDLGQEGQDFYIAMEYLEGESLGHLARESKKAKKPLPPEVAAAIVEQACEGLHYAHTFRDEQGVALNIVHRDVSPANVIVLFSGAVKLVDFGVAKAATKMHKTRTGTVKGKLAYMSPEQLLDQSMDARSDVFALGVVLWELLARRRLFKRGNEPSTIRAILDEPIPSPTSVRKDLPGPLNTIVVRALSKDPAERFQSAAEMAEALKAALPGKTGSREIAAHMEAVFGDRARTKQKLLEDLQKGDLGSVPQELKPGSDSLPSASVTRDKAPEPPPLPGSPEPTKVDPAVPTAGQPLRSRSDPTTKKEMEAQDPSGLTTAGARKGIHPLVAILPILLLLGGAATAWHYWPRPDETASAGQSKAPESDAGVTGTDQKLQPPVRKRIHVTSSPTGALVTENGKPIGKTPLDLELESGQARRIRLELAGYQPVDHSVDERTQDQLELDLIKSPKKPTKKKRKRKQKKRKQVKPGRKDPNAGDDLYKL